MPKILTTVMLAWIVVSVAAISAAARPDPERTQSRAAFVSDGPSTVPLSAAPVPADHTERHAAMTNQMRVGHPDAGMQARMNADPMWQMMRDPAHIRAEEDHRRQIDRMLARNPE